MDIMQNNGARFLPAFEQLPTPAKASRSLLPFWAEAPPEFSAAPLALAQ